MANVRYDFLCHLLKRVGSANLNGVKIIKHLKPPIWKEKAMCMSLKTYSIDDFTQALSEQSLTNLCLSKAYITMEKVKLPTVPVNYPGMLLWKLQNKREMSRLLCNQKLPLVLELEERQESASSNGFLYTTLPQMEF